jgi:hypothetical protein
MLMHCNGYLRASWVIGEGGGNCSGKRICSLCRINDSFHVSDLLYITTVFARMVDK